MLDRAGHAIRIPITKNVRSLNLANAASVILYEALRRLGSLPA
jgi:tRNA (cytidine/uridine-2'-O-)-methyltransferase